MKHCTTIRAALPSLLYGDLAPEESAAALEHLAACPACRAERAALEQVRTALDTVPAPAARVDLPRLYDEAGRIQARSLRRWRRAALGFAAAAAVLLAALGLGLQVRVEGHQLALRWGDAPAEKVAPAPQPAPPAVSAEDLLLLKQLVHALAADSDARDRDRGAALDELRIRLDDLHAQLLDHRDATRRDVSALYIAQFGSGSKGERP